MKPWYCRSVNSKGAGRPRLTHHHRGWWNETKWMRWAWWNGGMKFVVGENGRNPEKNPPIPRFVHHETHMEWPRRELGTPEVGGERLTACATRPPYLLIYYIQYPTFFHGGYSIFHVIYCMPLYGNNISFSWKDKLHFTKLLVSEGNYFYRYYTQSRQKWIFLKFIRIRRKRSYL